MSWVELSCWLMIVKERKEKEKKKYSLARHNIISIFFNPMHSPRSFLLCQKRHLFLILHFPPPPPPALLLLILTIIMIKMIPRRRRRRRPPTKSNLLRKIHQQKPRHTSNHTRRNSI